MYYEIVDINENFFNCGHYPEFVVEEREQVPKFMLLARTNEGEKFVYENKEEAEEVAAKWNRRSSNAWHDFLNS